MQGTELKSNLHKIIDSIQNEELLQSLYDFLRERGSRGKGKLWNSLSDEQKAELYRAFEESEDVGNLLREDDLYKED